jgi:hypothetical protein
METGQSSIYQGGYKMSAKELVASAKASAPVPVTTYLTGWDASDIFEGEKKYRMEEDEDIKAELKSGELTEDQLEKSIWEDQDLFDSRYEDLCMNLTDYLNKISPNGYFKAIMKNFGWMNSNGHKVFHVTLGNGREFLSQILPNCDNTFKIFKVHHGRKLAITCAHHDSPVMYKEWYIITPCSRKTYEYFNGR